MTKEQALLDNIPDNCIWEDKLANCPQSYVYQSMDEYAKQQCIAFSNYIVRNSYQGVDTSDEGIIFNVPGMATCHTAEELYIQFLNHSKYIVSNGKGN